MLFVDVCISIFVIFLFFNVISTQQVHDKWTNRNALKSLGMKSLCTDLPCKVAVSRALSIYLSVSLSLTDLVYSGWISLTV